MHQLLKLAFAILALLLGLLIILFFITEWVDLSILIGGILGFILVLVTTYVMRNKINQ